MMLYHIKLYNAIIDDVTFSPYYNLLHHVIPCYATVYYHITWHNMA